MARKNQNDIAGIAPIVYTVPQVARMLQVTPTSILNWIRDGRIAAFKVGPRSTRIRREEVERILSAGVYPETETDGGAEE